MIAKQKREFTEEHRKKLSLSHFGKPSSKKGKKLSDETKLKISLANKGRISPRGMLGKHHTKESKNKLSIAHKGDRNVFFGKKHTDEAKKRMSISRINNDYTKDKSPSWIDGRSFNKEYVSWSKNKRNRLRGYLKNIGYGHTFGEWEILKKQYNYTCPCCKISEPEVKLTEDHIIPLSKGGSDLIENIQPLCSKCNFKKHTLTIKY